MSRSTHRRRYLELLSTGLLGVLGGCVSNDDNATSDEFYTGDTDGSFDAQSSEDIGLTAGGAQDVGDFRNNVEEGYLPLPESLSYEGLFSEYYFDTGGGEQTCESLFCAAYSPAATDDPLSGERERYFTVGLDSGRSLEEFERPAVNLVVVLDVSGSMSSPFDEYYYDEHGERQSVEGETDRAKMAVARDALETLTEQLRPGDRIGIVEFESSAETTHRMQDVEESSMASLRDDVQSIQAGGGTDISAGIETGIEMLQPYRDADRSEYENRLVVLTDAQPNLGETSAHGLRGTLESAADDGIHTSFVGVGLDFNPELVDRITSIRGANYYTVRSADEFERRMGEEFPFVVTPLVFDLSVELESSGAEIVDVYGTSVDDRATTSLLSVPTLFPSPKEEGKTRGGVILVQVASEPGAEPPELTASWETRTGEQRSDRATVTFPEDDGEQFDNSGVRKAVLLARYGNLVRNWAIYERDDSLVAAEEGIDVPPESGLGRWEHQSESLRVSEQYRERFGSFRDHLESEMDALSDDDLERELDVLDAILAADDAEAQAGASGETDPQQTAWIGARSD